MSENTPGLGLSPHTGPSLDLVDSGSERIIGRRDGPIGWLIFNNPLRRNAVSLDMWEAIPRVLADFEADPDIRVIVLTGAGEQAFVSGADISQFEAERASPEANARYGLVSGLGQAAIQRLEKPSIAMIQGYCIGGGLAVALSCDLRIAAEGSKFGIPAARLGLGYEFPGVLKLTETVGPAFAKEIFFTARQFEADEAYEMGLINRVVPSGDLELTVRQMAETIGANAPLTVKAAKLAVNEAMRDPAKRDLARVDAAVSACFASEDYKEGRAAFLEKRPARFQGR
jgi:enoyl-CoA hydratase/carnithine racemase